MKTIERIKLSNVLRLVSNPKYVLGTTYTLSLAFFESVVYPLIRGNQLRSAVILCDMLGYSRALSESAALQGAAQDYLVVPAPVAGAFHPKVWVIVGEGEAVLLCGSGNLTQAGFMTNAEYFDAVHISAKEPPPRHLVESLKSFVRGLASMWPPGDAQHLLCVEVLNQIADIIGVLPASQGAENYGPWFIHSFNGQLINQLSGAGAVRDLYVAAPFFGNSLTGLKMFAGRFNPRRLHVFPAIHGGHSVDIPLKQLAAAFKGVEAAPLSTVAKKNALAHLKLYSGVVDQSAGWICCTSANCTQAAWQGPNIEAGLVRNLSRSDCLAYFLPAKGKLPERALEYKREDVAEDIIPCWAADMGGSMDLAVSESKRGRIPLSQAELTIRSGNRLASCRMPVLFQEGTSTSIPWSNFEGWERARNMSVTLEICAVDSQGKAVRGQCLVENRLLLTADPIHRSAWRGALALLDAEHMPELSDIAALITLGQELFDGNVISDEYYRDVRDEKGNRAGWSDIPAIAIWPPLPDSRELQKRIGRSAFGQIQWVQRILQTLLRGDDTGDYSSQEVMADTADEDEIQSEEVSDRQREEERTRVRSVARHSWDHAYGEFSRLCERLHKLCPSEHQALNLWPAAVLMFLPLLAIMRAARRMAGNMNRETNTDYLIERFIRCLCDERRQGDNVCCSRKHRYYPGTIYPSLARDLRMTFKVKIHSDLSVVFLALVADWKLRSRNLYPQLWERLVQQTCDPDFHPGEEDKIACRRIWRHYVADEANNYSDAEFNSVFDALCQLKG